jgi:hypothetical protein
MLFFSLLSGRVPYPTLAAIFPRRFPLRPLNYNQSPTSLEFLLVNPLIPKVYFLASRLVRKRLRPDLRTHCMRDVLNLLGFSLTASLVAASTGPGILAVTGSVPPRDASELCLQAGMDGFLAKPLPPAFAPKFIESPPRSIRSLSG